MKKNIQLSTLLEEMVESGFSGHSNISLDSQSASLVYRRGKCLLAEYGSHKGKDALEQAKTLGDREVSAELYVLDEKQIELSLEFNAGSVVRERISEIVPPAGQPPGSVVPKEETIHPKKASYTPVTPIAPPIQLPRGKFHALKKGITLASLIDEMRGDHFSGYAAITLNDESATLVVEDGIFLLAHFYPERGSEALQIMQTSLESQVSAELYSLSPPQMQLALEFNRDYRVSVDAKMPIIHVKPQKMGFRKKTDQVEPGPIKPVAPPESPQNDDFEEELKALESMDLQTMTEQFKVSFKDVLNQLEFDHLIEEDEETDEGSDEQKEASE